MCLAVHHEYRGSWRGVPNPSSLPKFDPNPSSPRPFGPNLSFQIRNPIPDAAAYKMIFITTITSWQTDWWCLGVHTFIFLLKSLGLKFKSTVILQFSRCCIDFRCVGWIYLMKFIFPQSGTLLLNVFKTRYCISKELEIDGRLWNARTFVCPYYFSSISPPFPHTVATNAYEFNFFS